MFILLIMLAVGCVWDASAQNRRKLSDVVVTPQFELVPNVSIEISSQTETLTTNTNAEGAFSVDVPAGPISVKVSGRNLLPVQVDLSGSERSNNLQFTVTYIVPPVSESITIQHNALTPQIELRNAAIYRNSLFVRDDQLIHTLNAGINAGKHESIWALMCERAPRRLSAAFALDAISTSRVPTYE